MPEGGQYIKKKVLLALIPLTILMLVSSGVVYAVDKTNEIEFTDPAVETAVREVLGRASGTIHEDDVEVITWLIIHGNPYSWEQDIIGLSGLEHLSNLRQLTIYNVGVTDFSPLAGLTGFKSVHFTNCKTIDLASLSTLPHLDNLRLKDCDVSLVNLSNLTGLRQLSITDIRINDVSQLSFPSGLWSLHLQNNSISDIPQLSNLANLMSLSIIENQINDITPLSELPELSRLCSLDLAENRIRDITSLATLEGLNSLDLSGNHISTIDVLSGLKHLNYLRLQDNDIVDLAPVLEMDFSGNGGHRRITADGTWYNCGLDLYVKDNPLSDASIDDYIPQLEMLRVMVDY